MLIPTPTGTIAPVLPLPSKGQLRWQRGEVAVFVHFTVNTFTGKEWGDGTESPAIFNPAQFDANQWAAAAKAAGASHMVLTAKHHDGFCLWPSAATNHTIAASPYKGGKGDIVREFADACRRHDLGVGLYLSPWDRHEKSYGDSPAYNRFYLTQLRELLTNYGDLVEIWFDGACGEGPNGKKQQYDWKAYFDTCAELQPDAVTFGDGGTSVRWIGNEKGTSGDPNWSTVDPAISKYPGDAGLDLPVGGRAKDLLMRDSLQHGNWGATTWRPGECDVSIRPGWFYHAAEDSQVRSLENLAHLYFQSAGRNAQLLLNVPPAPTGLFHATDVARLKAFGEYRRRVFGRDLALGSTVALTETTLELTLPSPQTFDILSLSEQIELGQRVNSFRVFYQDVTGNWQWLIEAMGIGHKRLDRFDPITARALRIVVDHQRAPVVWRDVSLHSSR